jgi:hypothetical protein
MAKREWGKVAAVVDGPLHFALSNIVKIMLQRESEVDSGWLMNKGVGTTNEKRKAHLTAGWTAWFAGTSGQMSPERLQKTSKDSAKNAGICWFVPICAGLCRHYFFCWPGRNCPRVFDGF